MNGKGQGEGIEGQYDKYLHSEDGRRVARVDGSKRRNMLGYWTLQYEPPSGGDRVQLTLDSTMQRSLELKLDQALSFSEASRAMGILMDSHTGDILALATRPAFDPNRYMEFEAAARKNRAVVDLFAPGSAFKIVPAAPAREGGPDGGRTHHPAVGRRRAGARQRATPGSTGGGRGRGDE